MSGGVRLVYGAFEERTVHPDWPTDQLDAWYEAPVAALSFEDNCVLARVSPGPRPGAPARVDVVPDVGTVEVSSSAVTVSGLPRSTVTIHRSQGGEVLSVRGQIGLGSEPLEAWVTVDDPVAYFGAALRAGLRQAGVTVDGADARSAALEGDGWRTVAVRRTDLLSVLEVMNQRSQNLFAESVFKLLGRELCGAGSWAAGRSAVEEFLREDVGLAAGSFSLADGSGMSRENRFTPRQLTRLLDFMFHHRWGKEFLRTLPFSGQEDLRWERRLAEPPYRGNVFAKTGGLRAVSTLSGYAKARSGRLYAFSILCNDTRSNFDAMRAQDAIVEALIDRG
ncbi:MAG: D-alanyl-D-alanine carboxypeptidase/D-alanyl-D-alanine-endopeptidase [Thermoanaerobaculia bacterium]